MQIDVLSLFPGFFQGPLTESILKRAQESGIVKINLVDIRAYSLERHHKVDDRPYGGGPGMVMMAPVVTSAVRDHKKEGSHVIYLSPRGRPLTAKRARELAQVKHLVLLSGHYEGIDQRAVDSVVDEEISIGDYVLTNGCLAACVLIDATVRFLPGALGHDEAANFDSFETKLLDWPHYTRPEIFEGVAVPEALKSGNHSEIKAWRLKEAQAITRVRRPDLWIKYLCEQEQVEYDESKSERINGRVIEITLPTSDLQATETFYRKLFRVKNGRRFRFENVEVSFAAAAEHRVAPLTLNIEIETQQFDQLVNRAIKNKIGAVYESAEKNNFVFSDPDGSIWNICCQGMKQDKND